PMCAGMPTPMGCQPAAVRCQTSILADEPPTPTTEITCVAAPTELANQGSFPARPAGATDGSSDSANPSTTAHSTVSSRRTPSMVTSLNPTGQVKVQPR